MKNFIPILFLFLFFQSQAQNKMEVIRCEAVDRSSPVTNVHIDEAGQIWVGNRKGLNRVLAPDNGSLVDTKGEWSLLQTHDGNADIRLPLDELIGQMGADGQAIASKEDRITAATFDKSKGDLWVGTQQSGLFQFKIEPALKLEKQYHSGNSKLASDQINTLFLDRSSRLWIGTEEGACFGRSGNWRLEERYFNITAFAQNAEGEIWVMGNDQLWRVDARQRWIPIDIEDAQIVEGRVADIAFDTEGKLWIASEIVSQYDPETGDSRVFGPAQEFTSQDVFQITVDEKNVVWIGTNDKGLYIIQKAATLYVACEVEKYISCNSSANDAALKVSVDGGTEPYTYRWEVKGGSTSASGQNPSNLGPGEYSLVVSDSKGKKGRAKVNIPDPNITAAVTQDKPASPSGVADGSATVTAKGGQPDYTFRWTNGETTATANKLEAGDYSVTVTDQAGCTAVGNVIILQEVGKLSLSSSQIKEISCAGAKDAALEVITSGGQGNYTYQWSEPGLSGNAPKNLPAGQYQLTVSDESGQAVNANFTVNEPDPILVSIKVDAPASTGNEDGKATVSVEGGQGSLTYKWSNGETDGQALKLGPGDHSITVTDALGCSTTEIFNISENILALKVELNQTAAVKCAGGASASLQAEVSGGKGPFRFAWSEPTAQGDTASDLPAGTFEVTVTDNTGATATAKASVKDAKAISISAKVNAPASTGNADGKATVKASGGTGDFNFAWSNSSTEAAASGFAPGDYTVTATDAAGCTATTSVNISENILQLSVSISQTQNIACAGEATATLQAEPNGGKPTYTYNWSGGLQGQSPTGLKPGKYTLTLTDAVGTTATSDFEIKEPKPIVLTAKVDAPASTGNADGKASAKASGGTGDLKYAWSNGMAKEATNNLGPGNFTVTVTDAAGCTATASVDISENILPLSVSISQTQNIACAGEATATLQAEPNGGKPTYTYNWSGGLQGQSPTGLKPGEYTLTLTDAEGTTATSKFQITEPQPISVDLIKNRPATTVESNNGKALLKPTGGSGKFSYKWDNGETTAEVVNLGAGIHGVTVSDENGCEVIVQLETGTRINPELEAGRLRTGQLVKLDKIYFQPDSTNLDPESIPTLEELFEFMEDNPGITIEVGGHTNGVPSHEFCDRLSSERAKSVAQYLVDKGLPANRLTYKGYGKRKPIATNKTPDGRAKNQRVEIKIVSLE